VNASKNSFRRSSPGSAAPAGSGCSNGSWPAGPARPRTPPGRRPCNGNRVVRRSRG
jgi:hypothetical protein